MNHLAAAEGITSAKQTYWLHKDGFALDIDFLPEGGTNSMFYVLCHVRRDALEAHAQAQLQKLKPSGHNKISPDISAWMRIFPSDLFLFCDEAIWLTSLIEKID